MVRSSGILALIVEVLFIGLRDNGTQTALGTELRDGTELEKGPTPPPIDRPPRSVAFLFVSYTAEGTTRR